MNVNELNFIIYLVKLKAPKNYKFFILIILLTNYYSLMFKLRSNNKTGAEWETMINDSRLVKPLSTLE